MLFNVPQFIDIEDKIVGPLTAKQLGWFLGGGVVLLVLYSLLDQQAFFLSAIIVAAITSAFAFYRPYNQPLISFLIFSVYFVFRPRLYIWKRLQDKIPTKKKSLEKKDTAITHKTIDEGKIKEVMEMINIKKQ